MENVFDDELIGMVNYTDETVPAEMPVMECKAKEVQDVPQNREEMEPERAIPQSPAATTPVQFTPRERDVMDRLAKMAKWVMVCGGISMLLWWFEVNGLMELEASYPCTIVCAILAGYGVGTNARARK